MKRRPKTKTTMVKRVMLKRRKARQKPPLKRGRLELCKRTLKKPERRNSKLPRKNLGGMKTLSIGAKSATFNLKVKTIKARI